VLNEVEIVNNHPLDVRIVFHPANIVETTFHENVVFALLSAVTSHDISVFVAA
jgi:hypothetical protein